MGCEELHNLSVMQQPELVVSAAQVAALVNILLLLLSLYIHNLSHDVASRIHCSDCSSSGLHVSLLI